MRYRLLGPLEVIGEDGGAVALAGGRERVLLATLVLGANQTVSSDRLVDALWGEDPPATAANSLQVHVSKLRKKLAAAGADDGLSSAPRGYVLRTGPDEVDLEEFERLVSAAVGDPAEVSTRLREALAMWRGPALADVSSDLLAGEKTRLEELRLLTIERRIEADLTLGRHADLIGELEALVQADPLREGPRRQLMLALYRSGRQADALATYKAGREVLAEELGIDPGPELQALEMAILNQDPELDAPAPMTVFSARSGPPSGTVILLMSDIEGSTRLWEEHPEAMAVALRRHDELIRRTIEENGGYVFKTVGDAFSAAFGTAVQAVTAAMDAQRLLGSEDWPSPIELRVRMALHTGECEERDGDYFGPAVNRVARLEAIAHGGQVLVSGTTAQILEDAPEQTVALRDLGTHRLKDLSRPEVVFQLEADGLPAEFPPLRSLDNPKLLHNLPELVSRFVGRDAELVEVRKLVSGHRLVTLTGVGGSGKTRLALQVAAEALDDFAEGVWLVELASLADPALVTSAVASALGVREEPGRPLLETLVDALSDRHLLVLLDNCEHLLDAAATLVDTLVRSCPRLCVLATSREALAGDGERVYRVPSLSLPEADQILTPDEAWSFDAVRLFADRALEHRPDFEIDDTNAAVVTSLCRKLDGMPLAIELATARLSSLSVADIEQRLDDRFGLLTRGTRAAHPRQRTLHALIDWSFDLLDENEQAVLCRLSVFAGGWTLESAEAVCSGNGLEAREVADILGSLVDKSLAQSDPVGNGFRYRLLETIRHYCADRLSNLGHSEQTSTHLAHALCFLALAEEAAPHLTGAERALWFDRIALELGNFRAAIAHFASDPASVNQALRIWKALDPFWYWDYPSQGIEALDGVLPKAKDEPHRALRAGALVAVAYLRVGQGDYAIAQAQFSEAVETGRAIYDAALTAEALGGLSHMALRQGDITTALDMAQEAVDLATSSGDLAVIADAFNHRGAAKSACGDSSDRSDFEEALAGFRDVDNHFGISRVLQSLAIRELKDGNLDAARARINESLDLGRELPEPSYTTLLLLGLVELLVGNAPAAFSAYRELLTDARRQGAQPFTAYAFLGMGLCATVADDPRRAARLHGAADALFERLGEALDPDLLELRTSDHGQLRRTMGDSAFETDYQAGRNLTSQSAIDLALQEPISD